MGLFVLMVVGLWFGGLLCFLLFGFACVVCCSRFSVLCVDVRHEFSIFGFVAFDLWFAIGGFDSSGIS